MAGRRPALPALLLTLILLAGCELLDDGPGAPRAAAPPTQTRAVAPATAGAVAAKPPAAPTVTPTPGQGSPTPGRGTPTVTATAAPTATATATQPIASPAPRPAASGYRRHSSTLFPYAVDYLETWRVQSGGAAFEGGTADLFAGDRRGSVVNTVTVFAQPLAAGASDDVFLEASMADLGAAGIDPGQEQERTIDGNDAYVFSYTVTQDDRAYAVTQAIFVRQNRGWVLTLTVAPEDNDRLLPVFNHMLDSFQAWG
jgi:hypothetical protein